MTSFVVDASVAVKWFFQEAGSKDAFELREANTDLAAPDILIAEVGHAVWKKWRRKEVSEADALFVVRRMPLFFAALVSTIALSEQASKLSLELSHPIYDCLYLVLAQRERVPIVTADENMIAAARKARIKVRRI
jgi:predicted nucleic acid-binding protein